MRGLEQKAPPVAGAAATPSLLGYLSPEAQTWLPDPARSQLTNRLITGLGVAATLACLMVLGQLLVSEPLPLHRGHVLVLLAGAATLIAIAATQALGQARQVRAARESVRRLVRAAQSGNFGFWGCNPAEDHFWATPASLAMLGLTRGAATLDQTVSSLHPDDQAMFRDMVRRVAATGKDGQCECRQARENGVAWLRFTITAGHGAGRMTNCPAA